MKKTIKRISFLALAVVLMLGMSVTAFADSSVTYKDEAEKFVFAPGSNYSPTDLFPNFKGVMPGDSLTEQITVRNEKSEKAEVKVYMRALGAKEGSEDFLSQMTLTVNNSSTEVYNAPADQTAQLTDWVCLGTLQSGGEILLDVTLNVPITMGNDFQNSIGYLDWQFKIERIPLSEPGEESTEASTDPFHEPDEDGDGIPDDEDPDADGDGVPDDQEVDDDKSRDDGTQTGDNSKMWPLFALCGAALLVLIALFVTRRKNEE